jgi:hypothetical protein
VRKRTPRSPPIASANANLEVVAKITYERKRTTSEVVPEDVTRARAGAWLDLLSPVTEWAGLKGDELRHRRELLRIQREDTLTEIVRKCTERLQPDKQIETSVPNKFLIPFLEQASLEGRDSTLVDLWANLLASASEEFSPHHIHFVSVISRIAAQQAEVFGTMFRAKDLHELEVGRDHVEAHFEFHAIRSTIEDDIKRMSPENDKEFATSIIALMDEPGISIIHCAFENLVTRDYYDMTFPYISYNDKYEADYSILESIGLIRKVEIGFFDVREWAIQLRYHILTSLGFYFSKACKILPAAADR